MIDFIIDIRAHTTLLFLNNSTIKASSLCRIVFYYVFSITFFSCSCTQGDSPEAGFDKLAMHGLCIDKADSNHVDRCHTRCMFSSQFTDSTSSGCINSTNISSSILSEVRSRTNRQLSGERTRVIKKCSVQKSLYTVGGCTQLPSGEKNRQKPGPLMPVRPLAVCGGREAYPLPLLMKREMMKGTTVASAKKGNEIVFPGTKRPLFALKTNLLFDAALMPNVELEVPIGKHWSVNGEYMFPWWLTGNNKYCLEIISGGLEGRYWLGSRRQREKEDVLTGHFLGLYAGGGKYDLQWRENGYQGEFFIAAGVSYGYARKINQNLRLEFNIGIGILRTDYRHYQARDNYQTLLWQKNGRYTWTGPTKLKVSLVWLLSRKEKKKGGTL